MRTLLVWGGGGAALAAVVGSLALIVFTPDSDYQSGAPGNPGECTVGHAVHATREIRYDGALALDVAEIPSRTMGTIADCVFSGTDPQSFDLTIDWQLPEGRIVRTFYTDRGYVELDPLLSQ